jgi:putative ABC transport system substrate-binding protein
MAWPLTAYAQKPDKARHIGFLSGNAESDSQAGLILAAFKEGMRQLGWIDGNNIKIEVRWAAADLNRMAALAKELVGLQPDLIVGQTTQYGETILATPNFAGHDLADWRDVF